MDPIRDLRGIVTVLNTPFALAGEIAHAALAAHAEYAIDCGVAGFLVPALASEVHTLEDGEREAVIKTAVEASADRVPVIAGCAAATIDESIEHAKRAIDAGAAGILIQANDRFEDALMHSIEAIDAIDPPLLMLQDWDPSGEGIALETIVRLFEKFESFRALKVEVIPAGPKYSAVLEATGGKLHISGGWAAGQMIEALDRGVHAFMPTAMHAVYVRTYQLFAEGKRREAAQLFRKLQPILAFSNQHLDISIHFFKRLLHAEGIYPSYDVRAPVLPFDPWHARIAAELIPLAIALEEKCRADLE